MKLGLAGGLAAVLVAVVVTVIATSGGSPKVAAGPTLSASPPPAAVDMQSYHDKRGITINVPAGWKKAPASSYTDFTDPADASRRMRINVEASGKATAMSFMTIAEHNLKDPNRCTAPYQRLALKPLTLSGHDGAELEYTCGAGTGKRHGIWAATMVDGHAYHFYLTVPDSEFDASQPIFDEMVKSFTLTAPAV